MNPETHMLKRLFSSGLRIRVLSHFFMHLAEGFHVRNLAGILDESAGNVARELANLEAAGLLRSKAVGNQKHYSLRHDSPIHEDLRNIFLKTVGVGGQIRDLLVELQGVELAFIYGSFASGEAHSSSDVDVLLVGTISERELAPRMSDLEERLGREVNYVVFSRNEIEDRVGLEGDFINEVFAASKLLLVGNLHDGLLQATG